MVAAERILVVFMTLLIGLNQISWKLHKKRHFHWRATTLLIGLNQISWKQLN